MRNGKCLAELRAPYRALGLLVEDAVRVVMETGNVAAQQHDSALVESAEVEFGSGAHIDTPDVAERESRPSSLSFDGHALGSHENFARTHFVGCAAIAAA